MVNSLQAQNVALFFCIATLTCGCASGTRLTEPTTTQIPTVGNLVTLKPRWHVGINAHLSHVSIAQDTGNVLVSTSGDQKSMNTVRYLNPKGKTLWTRLLKQPAKSQAIASDGSIVAVNSYDGRLITYDRNGKQLFESDHLGRALVVTDAASKQKKIVLINDDDSEPKLAFITYNLKGKELGRFEVKPGVEPVDSFLSRDQQRIFTALSSGEVLIVDLAGSLIRTLSIGNGIVGVSGTTNTVAVLSTEQGGQTQHIQCFDTVSGKELWHQRTDKRFESLQFLGSSRVVFYGNSRKGQSIAMFDGTNGVVLWNANYKNPAMYSAPLIASESEAAVTIEQEQPAGTLNILGIQDTSNEATWGISGEAPHGFFSIAFSSKTTPKVILGTGEPGRGELTAY